MDADVGRRAALILGGAVALIVVMRLRARGKLPRASAGLGLGGLLLVLAIGTNFAPDVTAVLARAFGERPLGLPVAWAVSVAEAVLLGPALLVLGASLLSAYEEARRMGVRAAPLAALFVTGAALPPAFTRARRHAIASGVYLVAWIAAWIAYASWRGI
jgi:hypothetical protein